jgi:hypothetical protein
MPRVGFEPTTPAFEQAKTVHAVDDAATGLLGNAIEDAFFQLPNKCLFLL